MQLKNLMEHIPYQEKVQIICRESHYERVIFYDSPGAFFASENIKSYGNFRVMSIRLDASRQELCVVVKEHDIIPLMPFRLAHMAFCSFFHKTTL